MTTLKIVCRNSALSLIQAETVRARLQLVAPRFSFEIITKSTQGDLQISRPLYELEGRDFFSKDIDETLLQGESDIAVHSMKDLSAQRLESSSFFWVAVERENPRDVAIFNPEVAEKISANTKLKIGTSSWRRQTQSMFALPHLLPTMNGFTAECEMLPIRGNVDTRLQQLHDKKYDGIILAAAGLNRLLKAQHAMTCQLLSSKKIMFLPLFECTPAPGQGAIVAETLSNHSVVVDLLEKIHQPWLQEHLHAERQVVAHWEAGCQQRFGVVAIPTKYGSFVHVGGQDSQGNDITKTYFDIPSQFSSEEVLDSYHYLKPYLQYEESDESLNIETPAVFIAHSRALRKKDIDVLSRKNVWCAGFNTWKHAAEKGIWCMGCADGLGLEFLQPLFEEPLVMGKGAPITILTHHESAETWCKKGFKALGTYAYRLALTENCLEELSAASAVFWHSFGHFEAIKHLLRKDVQHVCASGKTADNFVAQGYRPIVFPTIQTFKVWKKGSL
jgi:hydroxymethylbilane synthase